MFGEPWGQVKAAIRAWHSTRGFSWVHGASFSGKARLFWRSLRKLAGHSRPNTKTRISFDQLDNFARYRLRSKTIAAYGGAVMALVAFFGIRRPSEALKMDRDSDA